MGKKSNPNLIRQGTKHNSWKSKYFENSIEESSLYVFQDFEIKKYITQFLNNNGLLLHSYKLQYLNDSVHLYVSYYAMLKSFILIKKSKKSRNVELEKKETYSNFSNLQTIIEEDQEDVQETAKRLKFEKKTIKKKVIKKVIKKKKLYLKKKIFSKFKFKFLFKDKKKKEKKTLKTIRKILRRSNSLNKYQLKTKSFLEQLTESLNIFTGKKNNISVIFENIANKLSFNLNKKNKNILKQTFYSLNYHSRNSYYKDTITIILISLIKKNSAQFLAEYIAHQLTNMKKHKFFLKLVNQALHTFFKFKFKKIVGIKMVIKGRFNGAPRAKRQLTKIGVVTVLTLTSRINYHQATSYTPNGTFGIKIWICKKKSKVSKILRNLKDLKKLKKKTGV